MAVKDVTNLRKEGKLDEAYKLAMQDYRIDSNVWTRMSLFWVLRDLVQNRYLPSNDMEEAHRCLDQMRQLLPRMMDDRGLGEIAYKKLCKQILPYADEIKDLLEQSKTVPGKAYEIVTERFGTDARHLDVKFHEDYGWIIYRYIKACGESFDSVRIRCLLRDYMCLKNERPSLLHSMMLNYAINFSKGHPDFNFYNFFLMWGVGNLRREDFQESRVDGHGIPSLVYRICKAIVDSSCLFDVADFVSRFDSDKDFVVECLRQAYFWKLMNCHKENQYHDLWHGFEVYADSYSSLGASGWHSEILKIANRWMVDDDSKRFVPFVMKWLGEGNFRRSDWMKEKGEDGKLYPSLAVRSAKRCFELLKATPRNLISDTTLAWIKRLYSEVKDNDPDDDWNVRNYAAICVWRGETDEAISLYKYLLLHMGDKYYLWSELAGISHDDNSVRIGLLLKAKRLERNEDFLGDIHLALASLWQSEGHGALAKEELEAYANHRKEKGWGVSKLYDELFMKMSSCENHDGRVDQAEYIRKAEDYVYADFDWVDFVLVDKWKVEGIEHCSLYASGDLSFTVKTKRFPLLKSLSKGDIIQFRCNTVENEQLDRSSTSWMKRMVTVKKVTPLVARNSGRKKWSILPVKYGIIDYVNEEKRVYHILTQDLGQIFVGYDGEALAVNSFVKFREYEVNGKKERYTRAVSIEACESGDALPNMRSSVVVVDDVNNAKNLFHVVFGSGEISDIVRFDQTDIRPSVGDFLRVTYCVKSNKDGKKRVRFLDIRKTDEELATLR